MAIVNVFAMTGSLVVLILSGYWSITKVETLIYGHQGVGAKGLYLIATCPYYRGDGYDVILKGSS